MPPCTEATDELAQLRCRSSSHRPPGQVYFQREYSDPTDGALAQQYSVWLTGVARIPPQFAWCHWAVQLQSRELEWQEYATFPTSF